MKRARWPSDDSRSCEQRWRSRVRTAMQRSLCESCAWMRPIVTPKGSRFLLCQMAQTDARYPKYPPQPVVRCNGYAEHDHPPKGSK